MLEKLIARYKQFRSRDSWLHLRQVAYKQLKEMLFKSQEVIKRVSLEDFRHHYFLFCEIVDYRGKSRLGIQDLVRYLSGLSVETLQSQLATGKMKVVGNASWTVLHMGFRKQYWQRTQEAITYLLFGDDGTPVAALETNEVYNRLRSVLEGRHSIKGFGRAKVTPLLLICDTKDRFSVWNRVSDESLARFGLIPRGDQTQRSSVKRYQRVNEAITQLKTLYGFKHMSDVDLFLWFVREQSETPKPQKRTRSRRKPDSPLSIREEGITQQELIAFREERLRKVLERYELLSLKRLAELLRFPDAKTLEEWILRLPRGLPLRIRGDEVVIRSNATQAEIDQLIKSIINAEELPENQRNKECDLY